MDIEQLLTDRERTHGNYSEHAEYTQEIKEVIRRSRNYEFLTYHQTETLEMIAHKIGRILAGDPNHKDHWADIAGYAKLTADRL